MIPEELKVKVTGVTVISLDEWNSYQDKIPVFDDWFWTRTPKGVHSFYDDDNEILEEPLIYVVEYDQTIVTCNAWRNDCSFRPVLLLDSPNLKCGDKLVYNNMPYTVITPEWAICDWTDIDIIWSEEDDEEDALNWNKSYLRQFCDKYYVAHGNIAILNNDGEISEEILADLEEHKPLTFYHGSKAYDLIDGKLVEHEI